MKNTDQDKYSHLHEEPYQSLGYQIEQSYSWYKSEPYPMYLEEDFAEVDELFQVAHKAGVISDADIKCLDLSLRLSSEERYGADVVFEDGQIVPGYVHLIRLNHRDPQYMVHPRDFRRILRDKVKRTIEEVSRERVADELYGNVVDEVVKHGHGLIARPVNPPRPYDCRGYARYPAAQPNGSEAWGIQVINPKNGLYAVCKFWSKFPGLGFELDFCQVNHSYWELYGADDRMRTPTPKDLHDALSELTRFD
jgi:hypothetical protein